MLLICIYCRSNGFMKLIIKFTFIFYEKELPKLTQIQGNLVQVYKAVIFIISSLIFFLKILIQLRIFFFFEK